MLTRTLEVIDMYQRLARIYELHNLILKSPSAAKLMVPEEPVQLWQNKR